MRCDGVAVVLDKMYRITAASQLPARHSLCPRPEPRAPRDIRFVSPIRVKGGVTAACGERDRRVRGTCPPRGGGRDRCVTSACGGL